MDLLLFYIWFFRSITKTFLKILNQDFFLYYENHKIGFNTYNYSNYNLNNLIGNLFSTSFSYTLLNSSKTKL